MSTPKPDSLTPDAGHAQAKPSSQPLGGGSCLLASSTGSDAPLSVEEAQRQHRCRVCRLPIPNTNQPAGWKHEYGEMIFPIHVILNFGKEFAHAKCLERQNDWGMPLRAEYPDYGMPHALPHVESVTVPTSGAQLASANGSRAPMSVWCARCNWEVPVNKYIGMTVTVMRASVLDDHEKATPGCSGKPIMAAQENDKAQ